MGSEQLPFLQHGREVSACDNFNRDWVVSRALLVEEQDHVAVVRLLSKDVQPWQRALHHFDLQLNFKTNKVTTRG